MINLVKLLTKILSCPMVIEYGTSGVWTYRKWSDGRAECWGVHTNTVAPYQVWNNTRNYNITISYPTGLFVGNYITRYSAHVGNGFALTGTATSSSSINQSLYAVCSDSGTQTCYWYVYSVGRWK